MLSAITKDYAAQYRKHGFVILKGCLKDSDLARARVVFERAFQQELWKSAPYSNEGILNNIYEYFPEMLPWLITPGLVEAVKAIVGGPVVWLPECSVHRNRYIGWHKDTSIQERGGIISHRQSFTPIIQCAIYLQDNDAQTGGGLTLIDGSHLTQDRFSSMLTERLSARVWYKLLKQLGISAFDKADRHPDKADVASETGDVVLFDVRTDHRATQPAMAAERKQDKLAVFNTFGTDSTALRDYFRFMKERPEPYYRYYREVGLPRAVREWAAELGIAVWY